jgi:hypothetical protein
MVQDAFKDRVALWPLLHIAGWDSGRMRIRSEIKRSQLSHNPYDSCFSGQECVSLWILPFHHQRNGQRIASYWRHSPGVIDHCQLRSLAYHISNIMITSPWIIVLLGSLPNVNPTECIEMDCRIGWETPSGRGGFKCTLQSPEQSKLVNSDVW